MEYSFVCIDIETTSQKPEKNEIIEIGCVYVVNGIKKATYHRVFKPQNKIPKFIYTLTGLNQKDIDLANGIEDSISEIQTFLMKFGRTKVMRGASKAKNCKESAGAVRFGVGPPKPRKNSEKCVKNQAHTIFWRRKTRI